MGDKAQANKIVEKYYADPTLPAVAEFVRSRNNPDLSNKYVQAIKDMQSNVPAISGPASTFLYNVQEAAREQAVQNQLRGTRTSRESSGGVRDYSDVARSLGVGG
jgi:hypothetical protein